MSGRWPSNFVLVHSPPDAHSEGCERVGVKKVKGGGHYPASIPGGDRIGYLGSPGVPEREEIYLKLETVDDWRCVEGCVVARLGEQSGVLKSGGKPGKRYTGCKAGEGWGKIGEGNTGRCISDEGTCARFFFQADWSYERIEQEELWNGRMADSL